MPLVSVVMPTYNRAWIMHRAVASVLNQSFSDLELIIVDDGSNDESLELLERIDDPRLVVVAAAHRGHAAARNQALEVARGDIFAYLDTDNMWHPTFLDVMTAELTADYVLAYCSQNLLLAEGTTQPFSVIGRKVRSVPYNPTVALAGSMIDLNALVHRRWLVDEFGGFDEGLTSAVDWGLIAPIVARYPFAIKHVDQVLCDYYFFLRATTATVTNSHIEDKQLRNEFGLFEPDANTRRIRARVQAILDTRNDPANQ